MIRSARLGAHYQRKLLAWAITFHVSYCLVDKLQGALASFSFDSRAISGQPPRKIGGIVFGIMFVSPGIELLHSATCSEGAAIVG